MVWCILILNYMSTISYHWSHHVNMIFTHHTLTLSMIRKNASCKSYSPLAVEEATSFSEHLTSERESLQTHCPNKVRLYLWDYRLILDIHKCFIDYCISHYGYTCTSLFQLLISNYLHIVVKSLRAHFAY